MATKNFSFDGNVLIDSASSAKGRYSNLNLTQGRKCGKGANNVVQSKSTTSENGRKINEGKTETLIFSDKDCCSENWINNTWWSKTTAVLTKTDKYDYHSKTTDKSSKQDIGRKSSGFDYLTSFDYDNDKQGTGKDSKSANKKNSSTLSLHIAAYENAKEAAENLTLSGELSSMKKKSFSTTLSSTNLALSVPFEFPRQQEENQSKTEPEIMQFQPSQILFNPNQSVGESPEVVIVPAMDEQSSSSSVQDEDTVTHQQLYEVYAKVWASLNDIVDDEDKFLPANGVKPTFQEAKNFWKGMIKPRQRKLLWVATGFLFDEFPDDEAQFRQEEADGLINDTNVTTGAEEESSDDDDEDEEMHDLNDENIPPVVNFGANIASQNPLERLGHQPSEIILISSDEDSPQDPINAGEVGVNVSGQSLNRACRPETPPAITRVNIVADSIPPTISPVRSQMDSMNLTSSVSPARSTPIVTTSAPSSVIPTFIPSTVTSAATIVGNEVVEDSQPVDGVVEDSQDDKFGADASVETVPARAKKPPNGSQQSQIYFEEPDISPPRSPIPMEEDNISYPRSPIRLDRDSQISVSSDSTVRTPQSSLPVSQVPTQPTKVTPQRKRVIVISDESEEEKDTKVKAEVQPTSYIDEQIASPENQMQQQRQQPKKAADKRKNQPSSSRSRNRTRSQASPTPGTASKPRTQDRSRASAEPAASRTRLQLRNPPAPPLPEAPITRSRSKSREPAPSRTRSQLRNPPATPLPEAPITRSRSKSREPAPSRTRSGTNEHLPRKTAMKRGRSREPESESDENMPSDEENSSTVNIDFRPDLNVIETMESSDSSDDGSSSLCGFIVEDEESSELEEESSDESIILTDTQNTVQTQRSESSLNDEIYTRNDSVERDLPISLPRATVTNTPTVPKTTPMFAHVGKPRYAPDTVTTPDRPSASSSYRLNQGRQFGSSFASTGESLTTSLASRGRNTFSGNSRTIPSAPEQRTRTPIKTKPPPAERGRSSSNGRRSRTPVGSAPHVTMQRGRTPTTDSRPLPNNQRSRTPTVSRPNNQRSRTPTDSGPTPTKQRSRTPTDSRPTPTERSRTPTDTRNAAPARNRSSESRNSTISSHQATSNVRNESNCSRPSAVTNKTPSIPVGYELIDNRNTRDFNGQTGVLRLLIYEIDGRQYYRRYRPQENGYVFDALCKVYHCTKCKTKGKETLLKFVFRADQTFAQTEHHPECVMQVYDMEDD